MSKMETSNVPVNNSHNNFCDVTVSAINQHLKRIFADSEMKDLATVITMMRKMKIKMLTMINFLLY